jgi:hypothetical protein
MVSIFGIIQRNKVNPEQWLDCTKIINPANPFLNIVSDQNNYIKKRNQYHKKLKKI